MVEKAEAIPQSVYDFLSIPAGAIGPAEFEKHNQITCKEFKKQSYTYIEDEQRLSEMTEAILAKHNKIGVDIEQTFKESYNGYICLIQISTGECDFIVDVLALHAVAHKYLALIFESSAILKIFYAGEGDLSWLYRDFKIKVRNYCDVRSLLLFLDKRVECSLVFLVKKFCNFEFDKKEKKRLQVSDWWRRPLEEEQKDYAALDSHYLIYIRFCLLMEIIQKKPLKDLIELIVSEQRKTEKDFGERIFDRKKCLETFKELYKKKKKEHTKSNEGEPAWDEELKSESLNAFYKLSKEREVIGKRLNKNVDSVFSNSLMISLALHKAGVASALKTLSAEDSEMLSTHAEAINDALASADNEGETVELEYKSLKEIEGEALRQKKEKKQQRLKKFVESFTQKFPVYENCSLLAPNGMILCHCDRKKIEWYVSRNLATLVKEEPPTAKLNFEPSGEGFSLEDKDNIFYTSDRQNICVVCGSSKTYLKYHIVPSLYRQHLPNCYKSHRSHDVVLLCLRCHERANQEADKLKVRLSEKYKVPLFTYSQQHILRCKLIQLSRSVSSFRKNGEQIPKEYRKKMKEQLRELYKEISLIPDIKTKFPFKDPEEFPKTKSNKIKLTPSFLDFCENIIDYKNSVKEKSLKDFRNQHGKLVVDQLTSEQDIRDFIYMWRMYFLEKMSPNFLPHSWDLNHSFERKFGVMSSFSEANN